MHAQAIVAKSKDNNLQPVPAFTSKCIQLYETTTVRHGLMLVGPAGGAKTLCDKVQYACMHFCMFVCVCACVMTTHMTF